MDTKFIIASLLVVCLIGVASSAPITSDREQELTRQFVEFLKQDKEFSSLLNNGKFDDNVDAVTRTKRQSDDDYPSVDEVQTDMEEPPKKDGFFDRAAKFVMEVLQRFLKWINTDD